MMFSARSPKPDASQFLRSHGWGDAILEPLTGDASARRYFRLRRDGQLAVLMDATQLRDCVAPFYQLATHLQALGLSAPAIHAWDADAGFMLIEDFGDATFTRLLEEGSDPEPLYALATDLLIALHEKPAAAPAGLREYHPAKMLEDLELFLDWRTPGLAAEARADFRRLWQSVLPLAHQVPSSLLLRDFHVANLMHLPQREGVRQAGLLDFQDAYRGPVTYDLISLLEDARRDIPTGLREDMTARYLARLAPADHTAFLTSMAVLAAQRHTRVLAIFARLSARDGKHDYQQRHSPRVERLLRAALAHPVLGELQHWYSHHAW
jgi:aminoglycoside/choline kinase family phosphotransferase